MTKKVVTSVLLIALTLLLAPSVQAFTGFGDGSSGYPFQITSCAQLQEMASNLTAYFEQDNDIDCTGVTFTPIGDSTNKFRGNFNGNNFAISNISFSGGASNSGFFGYTSNATIQNIRLISGTYTPAVNANVGSLIGRADDTTITHVSSALNVPGTSGSLTGGLIGFANNITLQKSFYSGNINANDAGSNNVAGLLGGISGTSTVSDSYATGTYKANVAGYGGGLNGAFYGTHNITFTNVYSSAAVALGSNVTFGGLSGAIGVIGTESITNSFSAVTKSGSTTNVFGGAFGFGKGSATVTNTHFDETLTGTSSCSGDSASSCTAQNSGNSTPNYFKGNSTNAPMSSWDFVNTWQTNSGAYPTLQGFTSPSVINPNRTASSNTVLLANVPSAPACNDATPTGVPNLFQIDAGGTYVNVYLTDAGANISGYTISYGLTDQANQYADTFSSASAIWTVGRTISSLTPNTTYYFKVQGRNGCNAGSWSNLVSAKTKGQLANVSNWFANLSQPKNLPTPSLTDKPRVLGTSTSLTDCSYSIKEGDSLWTIAQQKWGSGSKYPEILTLNPTITESSTLTINQPLKLCN